MARKTDFTTQARNANRQIWDGINTLKSLQREWNALDYGNNDPEIGLGDGVGDNTGITKAEVGAVVFDTANALETTLAAGHATNMAKLL